MDAVACPSAADWSLDSIRAVDAARADRLDSRGSPDTLIGAVEEALEDAIVKDELTIGVDSVKNAFEECRAIIQFKVDVDLYDWFQNGRTGYRAAFWPSPENGLSHNEKITKALAGVLRRRLVDQVAARRIVIDHDLGGRSVDAGELTVAREWIMHSLFPPESKMWIAERLYSKGGGDLVTS